jgi:rhamnosyltransferase
MQINFKVVVCIVTYHPSDETINRIGLLASNKIPFMVYDNTPGADFWPEEMRGRVLRKGENLGLGVAIKALGQAVHQAGYTHMLYFDEDIIFDQGTLNWIHQWYSYHKPESNVGLIWFNYHDKGIQAPEKSPPYPIKIAVSACSLINIEAAASIGFHTDKWFLEGIDYDFCFRLVQGGYRLFGVDHCPGIDPFANQPGIYRVDSKGRNRLVRIQPMKRLWNFWYALLDLTWRSLVQGPRGYAYLFFRNIFTYAYDQINAIFWTCWIKLWKR